MVPHLKSVFCPSLCPRVRSPSLPLIHRLHARHLQSKGLDVSLTVHDDRSLLALQGPAAHQVLRALAPGTNLSTMFFSDFRNFDVAGIPCWVTRTGWVERFRVHTSTWALYPTSVEASPGPYEVVLLDAVCDCPIMRPLYLPDNFSRDVEGLHSSVVILGPGQVKTCVHRTCALHG